MSGFDKQIRQRRQRDALHLDSAVSSLAGAVNRKTTYTGMRLDGDGDAALFELCRLFNLPDMDLPSDLMDMEEKLDYLLESRGVMRRHVILEGEWWRDMTGPVLCSRKTDGALVLLAQDGLGRYATRDGVTRPVRINRSNASELDREALCFYRPLPGGRLSAGDMLRFAFRCPALSDWLIVLSVMALIALAGLVTPRVTELLFSSVIPAGSVLRLATTGILLAAMALGCYLLTTFRAVYDARITQKVSFGLYSAAFSRMLAMPTGFFKPYGVGDMARRVEAVQRLGTAMMTALFGGGVSILFSIVYMVQIAAIAPGMLGPALAAILLQLGASVLLALSQMRLKNRLVQSDAKLSGTEFSLFSGIQKIRLAGAEKRAFHRWAESYGEKARSQFAPPMTLILLTALGPAAVILGGAIIYAAGASRLALGTFMGFQAAYGMAAGALQSLSDVAEQLAGVKPSLDLARPLLEGVPEAACNLEAVHTLRGGIEVSNLSFRYTEDGPWIVDGLNLSIAPGSYVAIVGKTGCGKSTLIRLLLGFETPQTGTVFYDGKDIRRLDIRSLRRRIGTVLQDGKLFDGSIFHNIVLCAPKKTMETAWDAAQIAQIADDIRDMPMGMHTLVGGGGVSGGQRQRLLIARAVAAKPNILIFDEATSALDNVTQAKVSRALDGMDCTRIVIAHRLSTIRNCERIIVLDSGHIIEDGSYDELMRADGFFARLVERQRPDGDRVGQGAEQHMR